MTTLEDKILGEKLQNYCSSSEDESDNSDSEQVSGNKLTTTTHSEEDCVATLEVNKWEGTSSNTGPKGVLKDWQRFKQLETEKRADDYQEKIELMKKLTLTVQSALDEEREQAALKNDPELRELFDDDFLLTYQKQRMQEMLLQQTNRSIKFGKLIILENRDHFLDAIDKEHKSVTIIVHIYEDNVAGCCTMNSCLRQLCKLYNLVKFCAIVGSRAGMSRQFKVDGVPALLIYKAGQLVGNFIRLSDDLGNEFIAEDVQGYLIEHGMLEDRNCTPLLVKSSHLANDSNSDSD